MGNDSMLMNVLLVVGSSYIFYIWGVRHLFKAKLFNMFFFDRLAYAFFMASGLTLSLAVTIYAVFPLQSHASVLEKSVLPTLLTIISGEWMYGRTERAATRLLNRGRSSDREEK